MAELVSFDQQSNGEERNKKVGLSTADHQKKIERQLLGSSTSLRTIELAFAYTHTHTNRYTLEKKRTDENDSVLAASKKEMDGISMACMR